VLIHDPKHPITRIANIAKIIILLMISTLLLKTQNPFGADLVDVASSFNGSEARITAR
jgi:hypothetical protein